jgi:amino-acid N-acetyltransferase
MIQIESDLASTGISDATNCDIAIRPAKSNETADLFRLITDNVEMGHLLPRSLSEVALHLPRFLIASKDSGVFGCAELARLSQRVAEVRSLVVVESLRGQGVGASLLRSILSMAVQEGYQKLCAFTHDPRPFIKLGFSIVPHYWLPEKISTDCHTCDWFRRCLQYAVVIDLSRRLEK